MPSVVANLESYLCRDWMRHEQEEDTLEKMEKRAPEVSIEDEFEEVEPEPPPAAIRRKVSFADAFGLDLVSVKEYDNRDSSGPYDSVALLGVEGKAGEEYYLSCFFTVPASDQELKIRLQDQKLELESIEMLPGSTTIRGIIRVVNLCFHKAVYVHTTLDSWQSHFDLLAEYVPGSSDGETDRFSFRLMLTPPFEAEGTRVEFCLRYESATGTFWANNRGTNYVLFCHQRRRTNIKERGGVGEKDREKLLDENNQREIRSCLKAIGKNICTEAIPTEMSREISDEVTLWVGQNSESTADKKADITCPKSIKDCSTPLVDHRRKRRVARLAHMQDYFSHKHIDPQLVDMFHKGKSTTKLNIPSRDDMPIIRRQQGHGMDTPPTLTYHQIPLHSLDCGGNTKSPAHVKHLDVCNGMSTENDTDTDDHTESACDAWKALLSGPDMTNVHKDTLDQQCISYFGLLQSEAVSNVHEEADKPTSQSVTGCKGSVDSSTGGTLVSHHTEKLKDSDIDPSKEQDLNYQLWEEPRVTPITCAAYESKPEDTELELSGNHQTPHCEDTSQDITLPLTSPREKAQSAPDIKTQNSKSRDGISLEEFTVRSDTSKVKENTHKAVDDTLTFTGIRDRLLADRQTEESSEKVDLNKASRLEEKDSREQMETEFYTGLGREEMKSVGYVQDEKCESKSCTLNANITRDTEELQKDEEPIHEPQSLDAEDELCTLATIQLSWMGGNSRLFTWWRDFWSLGHVTRALVYSLVLLVIFLAAYLCDPLTCLAIYLFSLCWWCSQCVKQRLHGTINVD